MNHPDLAKDLTGVFVFPDLPSFSPSSSPAPSQFSIFHHMALCLSPHLEYLKVRSHDPEEAIRHDVIVTIINAGKKDLNLVNDQLLGFVRERTLDKRVRQMCTLEWCRCCHKA